MKNKLTRKFIPLFISFVSLVGCSDNIDITSQSSIETSQQDVTFSLSPIPNAIYGDVIEIKNYINLSSDIVASFSLKSLTPDTITIDESNKTCVVTGVGDCKVEVSILNHKEVASFKSYAAVSNISLEKNDIQAVCGDTLNLDDIVKVNVSNPVGGKASYIATTTTSDVVSISSDYKTVTFINPGDFIIQIKDESQKKSAFLTGTVIAKLQNDIIEFAKGLKNDFTVYNTDSSTGQFIDECLLVHAPNFVAIPYGFLLGSSWDDDYYSSDNSYIYWGYAEFADGYVYEYHAKGDSKHNLDPDTIVSGSKFSGDTSESSYFNEFNTSLLSNFKVHTDSTLKVDDYITCSFTQDIYESYVGDILGIQFSGGYSAFKEMRFSLDTVCGKQALIATLYNSSYSISYALVKNETADYQSVNTYLHDTNHIPQPIDYTSMKERITSLADEKNFTVSGRTYICDEYGNEMSVEEATNYFEPLHTYMMGFKYRFTENSALSTEIVRWKGVNGASFTSDRTTTRGYVNKDNKAYEVIVPTTEVGTTAVESTTIDENDNVTYTGLTLSKTPFNSEGSYRDKITTLEDFDSNYYNEFNFLDYDSTKNMYTFNTTKNGSHAMDNLRVLVDIACPDFTNKIFPTKGSNSYEAGYYGQGSFTLNSDGGFTFSYYISTLVSGGSTFGGTYSFIECIELTLSDIGTTTIPELENLSFSE